MMRYLQVLFISMMWTVCMAQAVIYPPMELEDRSPLLYGLDRMPDREALRSYDSDSWDMTHLYSAQQYAYQVMSMGDDDHMLSVISAWGTELELHRDGDHHEITRETHRLSRDLYWEKTYISPMHYMEPSELANADRKEYLAEWSSYLSRSELRSLGVYDYENLYFAVEERDVWIPQGRGLIYDDENVRQVSRWIHRTYRDIKLYTKRDGQEEPVSNSILQDMPSLDLKAFGEVYVHIDTKDYETVAVISLDDVADVDQVLYRASDGVQTEIYDDKKKNTFTLYPSTSFGELRFDFSNFRKGRYTLIVYNIIGKQMWTKEYHVKDDETIREDLSFLPKGTYQYTLKDHNENRLLTRRFAIIKP